MPPRRRPGEWLEYSPLLTIVLWAAGGLHSPFVSYYVFHVALVEMFLRLNEVVYAPFYALFLVGPPSLLIGGRHERSRFSRPRA